MGQEEAMFDLKSSIVRKCVNAVLLGVGVLIFLGLTLSAQGGIG